MKIVNMEETFQNLIPKEKNRRIFQKAIDQLDLNDEDVKLIIYQLSSDIRQYDKLKPILTQIKQKKVLWNHPSFNKYKELLQEHDEYVTNPFEVEDGIIECSNCKSKKTYSYQLQTRSSDEPMTTFCTCVKCGKKWQYSG